MNEVVPIAMIEEIKDALVGMGIPKDEAQRVAEAKVLGMGVALIRLGKCPRGITEPAGCMFCPVGHLTECHFPKTCSAARCSHYTAALEYDDEISIRRAPGTKTPDD